MKSIYLVLDMQNDLVHADGPNGKSPLGEQVRERRVVENTAALLARARDAKIAVGFVRVGFSADYHECPKDSPVFGGAPKAGLFRLGAFGTEIQNYRLDEAAYRGNLDLAKDQKGNNDILALSRPQVLDAITRDYLNAGSDIVSTNTFSANMISQADYDWESYNQYINEGSVLMLDWLQCIMHCNASS